MMLVSGNTIIHCHHNGWRAQLFKPPPTLSNPLPNIYPLPLITIISLHHNINAINPFIKLQYKVQAPTNLYSMHLSH